ncbi:MAG: hypothetical protein FGM48_06065, partial [Candidatus Nanopelagicaceae bacterium]|nr:hypothetical protein [Candidatus Nanopelagicaceae bacterium]
TETLVVVEVGVGVFVGVDGTATVGTGVEAGVTVGFGIATPLFQINFLPDFMQVNFLPDAVAV